MRGCHFLGRRRVSRRFSGILRACPASVMRHLQSLCISDRPPENKRIRIGVGGYHACLSRTRQGFESPIRKLFFAFSLTTLVMTLTDLNTLSVLRSGECRFHTLYQVIPVDRMHGMSFARAIIIIGSVENRSSGRLHLVAISSSPYFIFEGSFYILFLYFRASFLFFSQLARMLYVHAPYGCFRE